MARLTGQTLYTPSKVQRGVRVLAPSSDHWPFPRSSVAALVRALKTPLLKHFHLSRRHPRQQSSSQMED